VPISIRPSTIALFVALLALGGTTRVADAAEFPAPWRAPQAMTVQSGSPYHTYYSGAFEDDRYAVDVTAGCVRGIPVVAPFNATVVRAAWTGRGNQVILSADRITLYVGLAHLDTMNVSHGQHVAQGQQLGTVGNSGPYAGSCPHLHLASWSSNANGAGMPITRLSEQSVYGGARIVGQPASGFGPLTAYAAPTIGITAGHRGSFVIASEYHGPPLECGWTNLRVRGDGQVPSRFIDAAGGWWPNSWWVSPGGVKIAGCDGQLVDGQISQFSMPVKVGLLERPNTYILGTFAPVYDRPDGGGFWAESSVTLALRVDSPWGALRHVSQSITPQVAPGDLHRIAVHLRNETGHRITPDMNVNLATGGPSTPTDVKTAGGFNRLSLAQACEAGSVCEWTGEGVVPVTAGPSRRRLDWHVVVEGRYHAQWTDTRGIYLIEKVGRPPDAMAPGLDEVDFTLVGQEEVSGPPGARRLGSFTIRASGWGCVATSADAASPMRLGVPGDQAGPYLDQDDPRVLAPHRLSVPAATGSMVCSGDTVRVPIPIRIPASATPGTLLRQPLSEVTERIEWDATMMRQAAWLPIRVTAPLA
jgi:hypothetical protein